MQLRGLAGKPIGLMVSVVLVALNLRPSMAAVGPLLAAIRLDMPLSFAAASLLTMLPVMVMGLAMFFGVRVAHLLGSHRSVMLSLALIGVATLARVFLGSAVDLIASAVLAGLGVAIIQALMPALIKARFKSHVSLCMGLYVTAIMGGAAIAASLSPLILWLSGSWHVALSVWSALALLALCFWKGQQRRLSQPDAPVAMLEQRAFSRLPRAWMLGVFFGLGTASYTCVLAWLAPYYVETGWSEQGAGLLLGLGIGGLFPMSLIVSMDHLDDPQQAGSLTAFVQGIGYLIASLSPLFAGLIRDLTGSFAGAWWSLMAVVAIMLLMVARLNPRHYHRYLRGARSTPECEEAA
ncbi:MFS transporter [Pseudomonas coronafaciens pv. coronafaciens]|uniref:MFS transporter n=1 Tax=Pseudomonas coronafaciens TaxID=53409 RepID=UPI000EFDB61F|nr:MFS transporter [Pseudomonas coronafaciens]RMN98489.1 MFS transporter [Pseudomonas coronafaciens pv. coronafaciens]